MKRLFVFAFATVIALSSCSENIQVANSTLQTSVDGEFFRADVGQLTFNDDGSWSLEAVLDRGTITVYTPQGDLGVYPLGEDVLGWANFVDLDGNIYSTDTGGSGQIEFTKRCLGCNKASGTFNFKAVLPELDTLTFSRGVFFDIPIVREFIEE